MSAAEFERESSETLSELEAEALHRRLAPEQAAFGAVDVRDVAEATGLSEFDVVAHLRQIRAEAAFAAAKEGRPSPLPWIALGALILGGGITWWRFHPVESAPAFSPASFTSSSTVVRSVATTPLVIQSDTDRVPLAPPGFRVESIGQTSDHTSEGRYGEARALPYETVRSGLIQSAEALVLATVAQEGGALASPGVRYNGISGGIFSPRPGFVRLSMSGWAGNESAFVAVPLADAGRQAIRELAERVLGDAKAEQDAALAPVADPTAGIVSPPPGFSLRFAGRRLDLQAGPRVSFAPVPRPALAARLAAALRNAIYRDGRPPLGAWDGNAAQDAALPPSRLGHVEIMGPEGVVSAEIPTAAGGEAVTAQAVKELAERVAGQMEETNRRALEKGGDPGL